MITMPFTDNSYKMFNNSFYVSSRSGLSYGGSIYASYGDFYGGKRIYMVPDVYYNINRHLSVGLTYEYNRIAFDKFLQTDSYALPNKFAQVENLLCDLYKTFDQALHAV